jgi:hypothetical protein
MKHVYNEMQKENYQEIKAAKSENSKLYRNTNNKKSPHEK